MSALAFLAAEPDRLARFLAATGIELAQLRTAAGAPETLAAVLDYVLQDESLLLTFAAGAGIAPDRVTAAHATLASSHSETQ